MIAITFSTDWAPLPVIRYSLDLLRKYDIPATIFCTNDLNQKMLEKDLKGMDVELGIHPYIQDESEFESKIDDLKQKFPDAIGCRTHRFHSSTSLFRKLKSYDFKYDSSVPILGRVTEIYPQFNGLAEIPVRWSDDIAILSELPEKYSLKGPAILNFHPVHIFTNCPFHTRYCAAKEMYHIPQQLELLRYKKHGIKNIFEDILQQKHEFALMRDLLD